MNRRPKTTVRLFLGLSLLSLAACQVQATDETTDTTEQASSNYCGAQMPATPYWDGTLPPSTSKTIFLAFRDPVNAGEWVAVQVNTGTKKLEWASRVKVGGLGPFIDQMDKGGQLDVVRRPVPPPVGPIGQAAWLLEWADRTMPIPGQINALGPCQ